MAETSGIGRGDTLRRSRARDRGRGPAHRRGVRARREDIGTAALVLSTGAVVEAANGFGVGQALIQAKNRTKDEEQILFWLTCGIGLMAGLVLTVAAPLVARTYELPVLTSMVAMTGFKIGITKAAFVETRSAGLCS